MSGALARFSWSCNSKSSWRAVCVGHVKAEREDPGCAASVGWRRSTHHALKFTKFGQVAQGAREGVVLLVVAFTSFQPAQRDNIHQVRA